VAKPASGSVINTGNSLATSLSSAWGFLENTGTTTADPQGSRTGALDASVTWSTDVSGDPCLNFSSSTPDRPVSFTGFTLAGTSSWSIALRGNLAGSGSTQVFFGDSTTTNGYLQFQHGVGFTFRSNAGTIYTFTGTTTYLTERDYVLAYDQPGAKVHLYIDGVESGTGLAVTGNDAALTIDNIGNGYSGGDLSFQGKLSYVYVWGLRALLLADASSLDTNPYQIFTSAAAPAMAAPRRGVRSLKHLLTR
jgi:hypothetical protein